MRSRLDHYESANGECLNSLEMTDCPEYTKDDYLIVVCVAIFRSVCLQANPDILHFAMFNQTAFILTLSVALLITACLGSLTGVTLTVLIVIMLDGLSAPN